MRSTVCSTHSRIAASEYGSPVKLLFQPMMLKVGSSAGASWR